MINVSAHCLRSALAGALVLAAALLPLPATAHKASDAYLQMQSDASGTRVRFDVALRDLDLVIDMDTNVDGHLSWGEIKAAWPQIDAYVLQRLLLGGCTLRSTNRWLEQRSDGVYAVLNLAAPCRLDREPRIVYRVLTEVDATHRAIARLELAGRPALLRVLDPGAGDPDPVAAEALAPSTRAGLAASAQADAAPAEASGFFAEGVRHIVTGYDHVLFLLCLLLPCVMRRTPQGWQPVPALGQALAPVAAIVTAFTLAHSITLALAALQWVSLPAGVIEPAIALTIVLAAVDNLRPIFGGRRGWVTFLFGLVHGFGFAGVLGELNLPGWDFAWALLQFNLGLELGQLAIVAGVSALLYGLRRHAGYPVWVIRGGSCAALLLGVLWFVERSMPVALFLQ